MAASAVPESMPGTPTPPKIRLPGADFRSELRDLNLNNEWVIGEPVLRENERHAAVYSVLISETGQSADNLEAHVFALDGVEPKLRKHRQRCINRMQGRTRLKLEVNGSTIVVIATSQMVANGALRHGAEPRSLRNDVQQETENHATSIQSVKKKTPFQRESRRIRQREKRQYKRSVKSVQHETTDQAILSAKENESSIFAFLLYELHSVWDLWTTIPHSHINLDVAENYISRSLDEALELYLAEVSAALREIEQLESYFKERRSEFISLQHLRAGRMQ